MGNIRGRARERVARIGIATVALMACVPLATAAQAGAARPTTTTTSLFATPTALDFGDMQVGATSPTQQVTIANSGSTVVTLSGTYGSSGPFSSSGNCKGATLTK